MPVLGTEIIQNIALHGSSVGRVSTPGNGRLQVRFWAAKDQARGRFGRNSHPRGQNFALNWAQGEVGVSLKKKKRKKFFFFFLELSSNYSTNKL